MNKSFTIDTVVSPAVLPSNSTQRYLSLDVLRGMTIALMIVVNTPGNWETVYAPFRHARWHGFTITDLVFPTFLFVVGNAMSFSMRKFEKQNDGFFLKTVFKRTALIFLIGLFLNAFPFVTRIDGELTLINFSNLRILGVLQRIALCYCIAALVIHYLKIKGAFIFSLAALIFYWVVMYVYGGQPNPYSLETNAVLKLDLLLIPVENLYKGYGIPFEPEGLLSTLPSVVNVIGGFLAGIFIQQQADTKSKVIKLLLAGVVLTGLSILWNVYFPINKPIWTSSYVLLTVGLDLLILAVLLLIIEVASITRWTYFFEVFGKNPLFIYILSGMIIEVLSLIRVGETSVTGWIYQNLFASWLEGKNASLAFAIGYMLLLWLIGYAMDKKKVYIKV
jgi:predicted acyltransferase